MLKLTTVLAALLCCVNTAFSQSSDDLFQPISSLSKNYSAVAKEYQSLQLNTTRLEQLKASAPQALQLSIPFERGQLVLALEKVDITSNNFSVVEALPGGGRRTVAYTEGVFYQGRVNGNSQSMATISLVGNQVMGVIADSRGNIILGAIENNGFATNEYALYRETNLRVPNPVACATEDIDMPVATSTAARGDAVNEPVEIYFECDNEFYLDKGSNTINLINYVLGFFNNVAMLYDNEDLKVQVSQILVWTTLDPEANAELSTTATVLPAFRARMADTDYVGDYAHFLSTRSLGGGIAYVLGNPCNSDRSARSAVSAVENNYSGFPTYSWTVQVVTHELGHNFGSNHTQWCGWPGGALDNCVATEAFPANATPCPRGPAPVNGGTIMSYCHLTGNGINFSNGFGQQPGDRIRSVLSSAACFADCRMTIAVTKTDASCNQANGFATVTATDNTGSLTYLWSNGQTTATMSNAAPGTYHVKVTDAEGCSVMEDIVIGNSGTTLIVNVLPGATAGFCPGGSVLLSTTNNPAYTYQWSLNGGPIPGATSSSYTATTAGNYSVHVTSGLCSGSKAITVSQVATPVAAISTNNALTFCEGGSALLNGDAGSAYTYQWYRGGSPIAGATQSTYSATTSGSYTVKVSAGASCEVTSSATVVAVNPTPTATVTVAGNTSFCAGGQVVFTAAAGTGYSYQWYKGGAPIAGATNATYTATTSGAYRVRVTVGTCSATSPETAVTSLAVPTVVVTPALSTIVKTSSQTLTGSGAASYNWSELPDLVTYNATSGTYSPPVTTTYNVIGTAANGCTGTASATIQVIGCDPVQNVRTTVYSPSSVLVEWQNAPSVTSDTVQYRVAGTTEWTKIFVTGSSVILRGLQPNTEYEYNVIPLCTTTNAFVPSTTQTVRTAQLQNGLYIRLSPNPVIAAGTLEVISATDFKLQANIYDNAGKLVMVLIPARSVSAGQVIQPVNTSRLASGVYFLSVLVNDKVHTIKMAVSH